MSEKKLALEELDKRYVRKPTKMEELTKRMKELEEVAKRQGEEKAEQEEEDYFDF